MVLTTIAIATIAKLVLLRFAWPAVVYVRSALARRRSRQSDPQ